MVDHQQPQQHQQPPPWEQIGSSFVQHYYKMFDTDRGQLANLYVSICSENGDGEGRRC